VLKQCSGTMVLGGTMKTFIRLFFVFTSMLIANYLFSNIFMLFFVWAFCMIGIERFFYKRIHMFNIFRHTGILLAYEAIVFLILYIATNIKVFFLISISLSTFIGVCSLIAYFLHRCKSKLR
jgi:hypothetical protein